MRNVVLAIGLSLFFSIAIYAQGFNNDKTELSMFVERMYRNAPFEGVRAVDDYEQQYIISVLALDSAKYGGDESVMFRVAGVKAMSQASRFFNGSNISSELIIHTSEKSVDSVNTEIIETIKENSMGYVKALELLTNFKLDNGRMVFIYFTPIVVQKE